jgi:hypothetical protein
MRGSIGSLVVAALAIAGCGDIASPGDDVAGFTTYVAESVAGQELPALLVEAPSGTGSTVKVYLTADTLVLQNDGSYVQRAHLEGRMDGALVSRQRWTDRGRYLRTGMRTAFESNYIENVSFTADLDASGRLHVLQDLSGEAPPAVHVFRPVQP